MSEFHFDPATYPDFVRAEIPGYHRLQAELAGATAGLDVASVLDLGTGTGVTLATVLAVHPGAAAVGVDENPAMLEAARGRLAPLTTTVDLRVADLADLLPEGPFDLVTSALAVHHLDGPGKADLFLRIAAALRPGGRFVLGDVVVPLDPSDVVTPVTDGYDKPSTAAEQLAWLADAGFDAALVWSERDLVVVRADRR